MEDRNKMAEMKSKVYVYKNSIKWETERKGVISSENKPDIKAATPPEFKGHPGIWTPEDFFVASVNTCIMTTFLHYAERNKLDFISYKSEAEGILERVDRQFMFSSIKVRPLITVRQESDINIAKDLIKLSENNCLISNSIKSEVTVIPEIILNP